MLSIDHLDVLPVMRPTSVTLAIDVEPEELEIALGGGGGCKAPLKYVCEKLKNGKKCCGCVGDKNAQTPQTPPPPEKKCGSYCSQVVPASMEALARQTCLNNHPKGWLNCSITLQSRNIQCCCNWLE